MRYSRVFTAIVATLVAILGACGTEGDLDALAAPLTTSPIYSDALAPGWADWSWASRNLANAAPVFSGTRSISVTYGAWQGLYFHSAGVSTSGLANLEFAVNGGATAGPVLAAYATVGGAQRPYVSIAQYCDGGSIPANAWTRCRVPLSALGAANASVDGIVLKEYAGRNLPTLYLDDIRFAAATSTPSAPTGLTATASTASVSLAWTADPAATGYHVYRATTQSGPFARLTSTPVASPSYVDAAVTAGTTYWYAVSGVNAAGEGSRSAAVSATVPGGTAASLPIYSDALASGWADWSWASHNLANAAPVFSGTRSISVTYGAWQGLYFHSAGVSTSGLANLELAVNGGATAGPVLGAYATVAGVQKPVVKIAQYCDGGSIPANAWTRCRVPLSALGAANATVDGIVLKEYAGRTLPTLYFDDIRLAAASSTPSPSPSPSVSVSPSTASLGAGGTQQFTAAVTGTTNTSVTWTVQEGAAGGTINSTGLYVAPSTAGTYHVAATSVADPTRSGVASVSVTASAPPPPPPGDTTSIIPADRRTAWNPGIPSDGQLGLALGADGIPQRTTICATVSPGGDIQAAINACPAGQVVQLSAGTFTMSSTVTLTRGVVLRGAGSQGAPGGTTIVKSGGGSVLAIGTDQDSICYGGAAYPLAADGAKEATTVSVGSAASSFRAGDIALVDAVDDAAIQQGDCGYYKRVSGRSASQRVEVKAVDTASGTLTLGSPLHWRFPRASPYLGQITRFSSATTRWAGIERLRIQGGTNPSYNGAMAGGIDVSNAAYCWVKDVQTDGTIGGMHVALTGAYRCVVRDSAFHHSAEYAYGADSYGVVLRCGSSENLVENNVVRFMNKPILFNASGGGNVVAYNYADNSWSTPATWQEVNIDSHCAFPHMELVEGNWAPHMGASTTHGNAGYLTFFRNYASSKFASPAVVGSTATQTGNVASLEFDGGDLGMNVLGNVLGTAGWTTTYDAHDPGPRAVYQTGANGAGASDVAFTSLLRHGNFDTVNNAAIWDPAIASRTLPQSLYLAAKPGWWPAGTPWPWAGPDLTPTVGALPAKQRSDAMGL